MSRRSASTAACSRLKPARSNAWRRSSTIRSESGLASAGGIESLVDESIGKLVLLASHRRVANLSELTGDRGRVQRQRHQSSVLDPVDARHLADEKLRVRHD